MQCDENKHNLNSIQASIFAYAYREPFMFIPITFRLCSQREKDSLSITFPPFSRKNNIFCFPSRAIGSEYVGCAMLIR